MDKPIDYKKEYKDLYIPKNKPSLIGVPTMNFIMIDGAGDPNGNTFGDCVQALYAISYTIKMSKKKDKNISNYFEYVVPPLEGLWWVENEHFSLTDKTNWVWTIMIRQPEFVDINVFNWAVDEVKKNKPDIDVSKVRFEAFAEGLCVQIMHIGPYSTEEETMEIVRKYMNDNDLEDMVPLGKKHHEIYLSDPRKSSPSTMKTVLRHPVRKR